ncbi:MAG: DNA-directed RNA polymerase subunit omega [Candidatus Izemoplasmatales bacterium]
MIKNKEDLNQEKLLKLKEELMNDKENDYDDNHNSKNNSKFDPKEYNIQSYSYGDYATEEIDFDQENEVKPSKAKNQQGLRYPSIDNLLQVVDSKYKLAYIAAKRAKIIKNDNYSSVDNKCVKPVGMALEEILAGKVTAKF